MKTSSWIDDLLLENSHVETPESWLFWSFLCCISAAAGNNYFLKTLKGDLLYKPNLYVMLLGESGLGKGYPVNKAKLLVMKAGVTRVIAGRSSIQAIVSDLSTSKSEPGRELITDARAFIVNGELSTAIIADPDALTILTDLFDGYYNPEWSNMLKGSGTEKLKNPYITALFGSSPAHFYDSIPQANIDGGYIGRNLIIYEEERSKNVDLLDEELDEKVLNEDIDKFDKFVVPAFVPHLQKIASKKGRLVPTTTARKLFNDWRKQWRANQQQDKTGFLNRVPDHSLKVAMCLSLSHYDFTGYIDESDMQQAINSVVSLVYANKRTVQGRGKDPLAEISKMILDMLLKAENNQLSRKKIITRGYGHFNAFTFDQAIDNLLEIGWVKRSKNGIGKNMDWTIHLSGEPLENYKQFLSDKKQEQLRRRGHE